MDVEQLFSGFAASRGTRDAAAVVPEVLSVRRRGAEGSIGYVKANTIGAVSAVSSASIQGLVPFVPAPITWASASMYATIVKWCIVRQVLVPIRLRA